MIEKRVKHMKKVGYFADQTREYIIENMHPVRPLKNYLWNDTIFAELNQFCFGTSKCCINKEFKPLVNDVRLMYVKDEESGEFYDCNRNFADLPFEKFQARVGLGYQTTESEYNGLKTAFTVVIPVHGYVELQKFTVKNVGDTARKLRIYSYLRPFVNVNGHLAYGKGYYDEQVGALYYTFRAFRCDQAYTDVFYKASETPISFSTSDSTFIGYGTLERPAGVKEEKLPNDFTVFEENYCGAMQFAIELAPGEEKQFYFAIGTVKNEEEGAAIASEYATKEAFEREYALQSTLAEEYIDKVLIDTPDEYLNSTVNIWLKRQIALGKTWGRIYGKGFRDLLQDITGFVSFDAPRAKDRLLYTLKHQFVSGNGLRQFDPVVDYPYQDMPVWIPIAVLTYIKESGDYGILEEKVPYYESDEVETVFGHIQRGMNFLYSNQGVHGLGLWRGGDWNDSMNNCGLQGKGESVWLSIATVKATDDYVAILQNCPIENAAALVKDIQAKQAALKANILQYGFEKDHFIYGMNDWGEKVGSYENEEGKMYLNPQTWAVMAQIVDEQGSRALMDHVENNLKCPYGYLQNVPSYQQPDSHIGRITYFGAGLYENGSVYNHGVMFKVVADCMLGRADNAYETLKMVRYDNPDNPASGTEPYAISNMYFGPYAFAKKGFAPCSWVTGSAGWLYRAVTEYILGVQADFDGLTIQPCLPSAWQGANVERTFRGARYHIDIRRGESQGMTVDGVKVEGNKIPLFDAGTIHKIEFFL